MTALERAKQLELRLRAIYLATDRESDLMNWVDAGLVRVAIEESLKRHIRRKYAADED